MVVLQDFTMVYQRKSQNYTLVVYFILTVISQTKATSITLKLYKFQNMNVRSNCISISIFRGAVTNSLCGLLAFSETPYDYAFHTTPEYCGVCLKPYPDVTPYFEYQFHGPVWRREGKLHLQLFRLHYFLAIYATQLYDE